MTKKRLPRNKRFGISDGKEVSLIIQLPSGETITTQLINVSIRGVACKSSDIRLKEINDLHIIPAMKIKIDNEDIFLGRSVLKSNLNGEVGNSDIYRFMLIDSNAPIEGKLAPYLNINFNDIIDSTSTELDPSKLSLADFLARDGKDRDIFTKAYHYDKYHEEKKKRSDWAYFISRLPSKGVRVRLSKYRSNHRDDFIIMASNDYLGLASDNRVVEAANKASIDYGFGSTGSAITVGNTKLHEELEEEISRTFRKESALLFNSGYAANVGGISGLVGPTDLVVADILSHASIQDGMNLSQGTKRFFKHNDLKHLRKVLERERDTCAGALLVVEGVFSMDGDYAPLNDIVEIAKEYHARIMIDEAHSFGVLGKTGLGLSEHFNLMGIPDITMGTFSKICGGIGGFLTGSREVINWLRISARSGFFSVSLPPSSVAAALEALRIFKNEPKHLEDLKKNISHFVNGVRSLGFDISDNHLTPIIPVVIGDENKMLTMFKILFDAGIYTIPVVYPAVSKNNCRFRFTVSSKHSIAELDYTLLVLQRAMEAVGFFPSKNDSESAA